MTGFLRITVALVLSALLGLTGQSIAATRGMDRAAGQMVLCTGAGPVVVYVDDQGQPTRPPHYCPDYALSLLGAILGAQVDVPPEAANLHIGPERVRDSLVAAPVPPSPARAPPQLLSFLHPKSNA
ncbi:MAG: hypothetical protein AB3N07_05160 [Ruegeria sp.]